ncbi:MAG: hypothetical protein AB1505_36915, partial [Candidatus Latescibacterota bacterium]
MLLSSVAALCLSAPASGQDQFSIGVWQPGGHLAVDAYFASADVTDLTELDIDGLYNAALTDDYQDADQTQDSEEDIMGDWLGHGQLLVHRAPENRSPFETRQYYEHLEWYAGRTAYTLQPTGDPNVTPIVDALLEKWTHTDYGGGVAFRGYRVGHETAPQGQGIYDPATYDNLERVIAHIRVSDSIRRVIAIGNVRDDGPTRWITTPVDEQALFRERFFRPATEAGPANVLMHEDYVLGPQHTSEDAVQGCFDLLTEGWNRAGAMVRTALLDGRRAEWHFIAGMHDEWRSDGGYHQVYRYATLEELRAQTNLALSRGAKGITYFLYTSTNGLLPDGRQYDGLVAYAPPGVQRPHRPSWDIVDAVNDTLRPLGTALYPLTWVAGFPQTSIPGGSLVVSATGSRVEFGTFYDAADDNRDYLLVVNRLNLRTPSSTQSVDVTLNANALQRTFRSAGVYYLTNVVSGERQVRSTDASGQFVLRCPSMPPGAARLFRIERVSEWSGTVTLTGDVTIPAGTSLTIAAGTEVRVLTGDDLAGGTYPDGTEIIVQGVLNVNGSGAQPVVFRSADSPTSNVAWRGLRIGSGAGVQVSFAHTHVENPWPGIHLNGTPGLLNWG